MLSWQAQVIRAPFNHVVFSLLFLAYFTSNLIHVIEQNGKNWKGTLEITCETMEAHFNHILNVPTKVAQTLHDQQTTWLNDEFQKSVNLTVNMMDLVWKGSVYAAERYVLVEKCALEATAQGGIDLLKAYDVNARSAINTQMTTTAANLNRFRENYEKSQHDFQASLVPLLSHIGSIVHVDNNIVFPTLAIPTIEPLVLPPWPIDFQKINVEKTVDSWEQQFLLDYTPSNLIDKSVFLQRPFNMTAFPSMKSTTLAFCEPWRFSIVDQAVHRMTHGLRIFMWLLLAAIPVSMLLNGLQIWWMHGHPPSSPFHPSDRSLTRKRDIVCQHSLFFIEFIYHKPTLMGFFVSLCALSLLLCQRHAATMVASSFKSQLTLAVASLTNDAVELATSTLQHVTLSMTKSYNDHALLAQSTLSTYLETALMLDNEWTSTWNTTTSTLKSQMTSSVPFLGPAAWQLTDCVSKRWTMPFSQLHRLLSSHLSIPLIKVNLGNLLTVVEVADLMEKPIVKMTDAFFKWYANMLHHGIVFFSVVLACSSSLFVIGMVWSFSSILGDLNHRRAIHHLGVIKGSISS